MIESFVRRPKLRWTLLRWDLDSPFAYWKELRDWRTFLTTRFIICLHPEDRRLLQSTFVPTPSISTVDPVQTSVGLRFVSVWTTCRDTGLDGWRWVRSWTYHNGERDDSEKTILLQSLGSLHERDSKIQNYWFLGFCIVIISSNLLSYKILVYIKRAYKRRSEESTFVTLY